MEEFVCVCECIGAVGRVGGDGVEQRMLIFLVSPLRVRGFVKVLQQDDWYKYPLL